MRLKEENRSGRRYIQQHSSFAEMTDEERKACIEKLMKRAPRLWCSCTGLLVSIWSSKGIYAAVRNVIS